MKEEFEITLHAPRLPGVGSTPVEISPIMADFQPVAPWSDGRRLRWFGWGLKAGVCSGVRGGGAKQRSRWEGTGEPERRRRRRKENVGGVSQQGGGEISGTRNYHFALPYSLSFIRPKVVHI